MPGPSWAPGSLVMEHIRRILDESSEFSPDDKQQLMYLLWLLRPADERRKERLFARLATLGNQRGSGVHVFMEAVNEAILEFEPAEA